MNPIEFLAFPGDILEQQALILPWSEPWRSNQGHIIDNAWLKISGRMRPNGAFDVFLNSPYTPRRVYNGALNLLEPA